MDNMTIYEKHRSVPETALKPINAGRLKGMSDINPMFRIKSLTEDFGVCGIGWYYEIQKQWFEQCGNETVAFTNIALYIKIDGEWSKPIFGTGGSKLVAMESKGSYVSDEALKMSLTDALSVACKQLGYGADVYWQNDRTKYNNTPVESNKTQTTTQTRTQNTTQNTTQPKTQNTTQNNTQSTTQNNTQNTTQPKDTNEPSEEVKNMLTPEAINEVDKNLIPQGGLINTEQLKMLHSELKRTGIKEKVVLNMFKIEKFEDMSNIQAIACLNKFAVTPTRKE